MSNPISLVPRDRGAVEQALLDALAEIRRGEIAPNKCLIVLVEHDEEATKANWRHAGMASPLEAIGTADLAGTLIKQQLGFGG